MWGGGVMVTVGQSGETLQKGCTSIMENCSDVILFDEKVLRKQ